MSAKIGTFELLWIASTAWSFAFGATLLLPFHGWLAVPWQWFLDAATTGLLWKLAFVAIVAFRSWLREKAR